MSIVVINIVLNGAIMRRYLIVLPFLFACAKGENAPADSMAMAAAPAALTDADVAGTWSGTATPEAPDTGTVNWTATCGGGSCRLTTKESPKDTITSTYVLQADSSVGTSSPYADAMRKGVMVVDHYVVRISNNQVTGRSWVTLADKPDSVVQRSNFTGTKAP